MRITNLRTALFVFVFLCAAPAANPQACVSDCYSCGDDGVCLACKFGYSGDNCSESYLELFLWYQGVFTAFFSLVAAICVVQLCRFVYYDGWRFSLPRLLHVLCLVQASARVVWLQTDPHNLRHVMDPIIENLVSGLGIYLIITAYLLVVMMWAAHYQKALGHSENRIILYHRPVFITLICATFCIELCFRIAWRSVPLMSAGYLATIALYYSLECLIVIVVMSLFVFYGLKMYRNLVRFKDLSVDVMDDLRRVTVLTVGCSALCGIVVGLLLGTISIEATVFRFANTRSFMVEQFCFRALEILLIGLIMYFLRPRRSMSNSGANLPAAAAAAATEAKPLMRSSSSLSPPRKDNGVR